MDDVRAALEDDEPLMLLGLASSLLAALEPRRSGPFEPQAEAELPSRDELMTAFLDLRIEETSALLAAIAALSGDEVLQRRVHGEITARGHVLPRWLANLHRAGPLDRAVELVHALGDGEDVIVGARLFDGQELTAVAYVDHNMGTLVKDAFVVPGSLPDVINHMHSVVDDPDIATRDLNPADARARITEAAELAAITWPPFESESWPACRPLLEWMVRMLPAGGTGYQRPDWNDDALARLIEHFLGSPFGTGLADDVHRDLLRSLLWFGTDYGPGDPLRWSPASVEILLADWIPRKIVARAEYLAEVPELLRAFIRFCHHERGVRPALTEQALAAVDKHEPDYQRAIRSPRPQGPAELLAAMGIRAPADLTARLEAESEPEVEPPEFPEIMLDRLRRAVGGQEALDRLDARPLADEPLDLAPVPADIHRQVTEVGTLVDRCCTELLDTEYRTACRRLLGRVATGDPEIFRRRGRAVTAAAALCWVIGKANHALGPGGLLVKDLAGHFGLAQSSMSQRSEPMLRAIGVDPHTQIGGMYLGSPDYLTSTRRTEILTARDRYRTMINEADGM